jgi:hypothetical protein
MGKRLARIVFALALAAGSCVLPAQAHELKTDGDIGVMLHANPDDEPYAGIPTSLLFYVSDASGKFTPAACNCQVTVSDPAGKTIFAGPLQVTDGDVGTVTLAFPTQAVYAIRLDGTPQAAGAFQPFLVSYEERVDRTAVPPPAPKPPTPWIVPFAIALVLGLACLLFAVWRDVRRP